MKNQYYVCVCEELVKVNVEIEVQCLVMKGCEDFLICLIFNVLVCGIVKDIDVIIVGGVILFNGKLMSLVFFDDQMVVEVKILLCDVVFIYFG